MERTEKDAAGFRQDGSRRMAATPQEGQRKEEWSTALSAKFAAEVSSEFIATLSETSGWLCIAEDVTSQMTTP